MNSFTHGKVIGTLLVVFAVISTVVLSVGPSSAAPAPTPPPPSQEEAEVPALDVAPPRPEASDQPSYGRGFVPPPMDLSHLTGQRPPSDGVSIQALPSGFDWRDVGGQNYVTPVKNQGTCGACYAFAAIGNFESKLLIDGAGTFDFSENNAKECNYRQASCGGGNYIDVANLFSQKGTVLEPCDPYVADYDSCETTCPYQKTLLDWRIISDDSVPSAGVLKQYLYDNGPIFTALYAGDTMDPSWKSELNSYDGSYTLYYTYTEPIMPNHAVLIVGWDDTLSHAGGSGGWIVKNSWGTSWGGTCGYGTERGYFTIAYGSAGIGKSSSFMHAWQDYDPVGDLRYYDEGGWTGSTSYGSTTGWGLAVFTPTLQTYATRVEFWTTAVSTTVDVFVYNDFDPAAPGDKLTNKLGEVLTTTFWEAGYHSVPLPQPVLLSANDDVIAVVKFTNNTGYTRTVPIDMATSATGDTYSGPDDSSWIKSSSYDVAIRLRTTTDPGPDVSIVKRVIGTDFEPGDPITFTLTIANIGTDVAANVVVTDAVPSQVITPTCDNTLAITPTGVFSYVWNVQPLGMGEGGVITIYGWISPGLGSVSAFTNTATIWDPEDKVFGNNTSTVTVGERKVYLPLVLRSYPPLQTKTLYPIADTDVRQGNPTTNFGDATEMWAGYDYCEVGQVSRSLLQFDVSSIPVIPKGATLHLYLTDICYTGAHTHVVTVYRTSVNWSESSVTWSVQPGFAEAYGSASVSVPGGGGQWYSFDVTDLVGGWVNGSFSNYGLMVRGQESTGGSSARVTFVTNDYPGTTFDPYLSVEYYGTTASEVPAVE